MFVALIVVLVASYALAWFSAYQLSQGYLHDADASYDQGDYLDALVGYKEYDEAQKRYVDRGGYMDVEHIWADQYALPVPAGRDAGAPAHRRDRQPAADD